LSLTIVRCNNYGEQTGTQNGSRNRIVISIG
jgi:hypothetical protein